VDVGGHLLCPHLLQTTGLNQSIVNFWRCCAI
jgi:hypothetical protein